MNLFSSGMRLAPIVTSTDLLRRTWDVILSPHEDQGIVSNKGEGLSWKVYKDPNSDLTIIAFEAPKDSTLQADFVPSSDLLEMDFHHFDFLSDKHGGIFYVHSTAFSLLYENQQRLDELKNFQTSSSTRLIVTGHGLGGSVASLFTLSLLGSIWLGKNRPLCITFGSPLIGDKNLQQAISRSSNWHSCFLHLVALKDPLPRLFITNHGPQTTSYMPFGTFIFCSDVNSTCFENPYSILELLIALASIHHHNQGFQFTNYGHIVKNLRQNAIYKDLTTLAEGTPLPLSASNTPLAISINLQLQALGLAPYMQQQNIDIDSLVRRMENLERKFTLSKWEKYSPSRKLNIYKISVAKLEWYKKNSKNRKFGFYDSYKNKKDRADQEVPQFHRKLTIYWKDMVEKANNKPQKGSAAFPRSWLNAGTRYRRMFEPLEIADYYREGGKDYMTNRSKHFVLLEEWIRNETTKADRRNVEAESSNFWECVEKALLSRQQSMDFHEMEDNFNILSVDENEEATSTMCPSFWARVDQLLLSSKELNVDEDYLNGTVECDIETCFEAHVDGALLSRQGSFKENEKNINGFGEQIDKALLSRQDSMVVRERTRKTKAEDILTTDSCFWAHVEEALLLCQELKIVEEKQEILRKLVQFEDYVYTLLRNYEVSSDIFLQYSSYMRWWNEYKEIKGTAYNSELANFMKDPRKHVQYALGAYDFPDPFEFF